MNVPGRFAFFLLVALLPMASWAGSGAACRPDVVWLKGPWGEARFRVEVADTPEARARGLMFREELPRGAGMLFVYPEAGRATFWMKNTPIPLDMIFADSRGVVQKVHARARPFDLTPIDGGEGIRFVLEIGGGLAEGYGIGPGTVMRHPAIPPDLAAWPC